MTTYDELMKQLAALDAQREDLKQKAEAAKKAEHSNNLQKIAAMMSTYHITAKDIADYFKAQPKKDAKKESKPSPVKYCDPETGQTWTGRGQVPKWIKGKDRSAFAV